MSGKRKHIVLIGFMGSGKTTVGIHLAKALRMPFVDLDQEIENSQQKSINQIFSTKGEAAFRRIERDTLSEILKRKESVVLSTGGGTPCFYNNIDEIKKKGISFYLRLGRKRTFDRLKNDRTRPLVADKTNSELSQFIDECLKEREHYYKQANKIIRASDESDILVKRILKIIKEGKL